MTKIVFERMNMIGVTLTGLTGDSVRMEFENVIDTILNVQESKKPATMTGVSGLLALIINYDAPWVLFVRKDTGTTKIIAKHNLTWIVRNQIQVSVNIFNRIFIYQ